MTVDKWIADRETDVYIIADSDGSKIYDSRKTMYEPSLYIMNSLIIDIYVWNGVTIIEI